MILNTQSNHQEYKKTFNLYKSFIHLVPILKKDDLFISDIIFNNGNNSYNHTDQENPAYQKNDSFRQTC
jgi:hypothetical protein